MVTQLAPDSVDEATPHVLDNFINSWADVQVAQVVLERASYEDELMPHLVDAMIERARQEVLSEHHQLRLRHMRIALDSAVAQLTGVDDPDDLLPATNGKPAVGPVSGAGPAAGAGPARAGRPAPPATAPTAEPAAAAE